MSVDLERLSPTHREFVRRQLAGRPKQAVTAVSASTPITEYDSDAERRYAALLDVLVRTDARHWDDSSVLLWLYHPMKFRVGANRWYTPDFGITVQNPMIYAPEFRLVEVKGSWDSKNARESRSKLEAAAMLYPWFQWEAAVVASAGLFEHEVIGNR